MLRLLPRTRCGDRGEAVIVPPIAWENVTLTYRIPALRGGWLGLWDHLCALIRERQPLLVDTPVTLSMWVKQGSVLSATLEQGEQP